MVGSGSEPDVMRPLPGQQLVSGIGVRTCNEAGSVQDEDWKGELRMGSMEKGDKV